MILGMALLVGLLFGVAIYLILRRSIVDLIFGLILLSHAAHLTVFTSGGLRRDAPPLLGQAGVEPAALADAIPQALVLTAIVIGFGVAAFAVVLVASLYAAMETDDSDSLREESGE